MAISKINTRALANDSVTTDKVADNAITTDMVASGEIGVTDLADGSITNAKISTTAARPSVWPRIWRAYSLIRSTQERPWLP